MVFLKLTFLPFESVMCPSSSTCKRMLNTSGCAFSISSNSTTEYGFLRTFSLSCPPSSNPTYPGGEPTIFDTECDSIYSDISTRINAFSEPNIASASALESSVFPTPVGPKKRNEPIGRFGSCSPTRPRFIVWATAFTASSCPITRLCRMLSSFNSRSLSFCVNFLTGILVQFATTSAISFSVTTRFFSVCVFSYLLYALSYFLISSSCFPRSSAACVYASIRMERSICKSKRLICSAISLNISGRCIFLSLIAADASSIKSIALSGRFLSLM